MKIKYLSHSCFIIEGEGIKAIIDPFITGNANSPVKVNEIKGITHIFITHGHGDHIGDTVEIAKANDAKIVCNFEISQYLSKFNLEVHPMHIGGRVEMNFGRVKMTPALHGSGITTENGIICGGSPGGFLLEIEGKKIYHAGDTGLTMDMQLLKDESIDVALLPIGGNFTMDVEDALRAVEFINPKKVIPMHYKTFDIIDVDPENFVKRVKNAKGLVLNFGESIEL